MNAIEVIFSLQTASFACSGEAGALCLFPQSCLEKSYQIYSWKEKFFLVFLHWQSDNNIIFIPLKWKHLHSYTIFLFDISKESHGPTERLDDALFVAQHPFHGPSCESSISIQAEFTATASL